MRADIPKSTYINKVLLKYITTLLRVRSTIFFIFHFLFYPKCAFQSFYKDEKVLQQTGIEQVGVNLQVIESESLRVSNNRTEQRKPKSPPRVTYVQYYGTASPVYIHSYRYTYTHTNVMFLAQPYVQTPGYHLITLRILMGQHTLHMGTGHSKKTEHNTLITMRKHSVHHGRSSKNQPALQTTRYAPSTLLLLTMYNLVVHMQPYTHFYTCY